MNDTFAEEFIKARDELVADGFLPIEGHKGLAVGVRVRHGGQRYPEALRNGTGYVRWLGRKLGTWEQEWGRPNIELLIELDKPRFGDSRLMSVADYHVAIVEPLDVA